MGEKGITPKAFDVLIPAHEESIRQIQNLLYAISLQNSIGYKLNKIFLCSDARKIQRHFGHRTNVTFIEQEKGMGKPDALNKMLNETTSNYCIQNSADCIPASEHTYHYILTPLNHQRIGAVSSHPLPINKGFLFMPNIIWKCHDFVQPKLSGELFSFKRHLLKSIPQTVIHDDTYIHKVIMRHGYYVVYEPRAIVFNHTPETLAEYYTQRKKNIVGNLQLAKDFREDPPRNLRLRSLILMGLELLANAHGRLDYVRGKIPRGLVGYNLESTKEVLK